jgi:hypothetical protein
VSIGAEGYLRATKGILAAIKKMKQGIESIDELHLFGRTIGAFAFGSDSLNVYQVLDQMSNRKWVLTGLQRPPGIHLSPTLRHAQPGVAERFVEDLQASVQFVRENPHVQDGMAPIYGLAATLPDRSIVHGMLKQIMDVYYRL